MINKKGQGLSLNMIIVAAIALIVLVIIVMIFTGRIGIFRQGVEDCTGKGGTCSSEPCAQGTTNLPGTDCGNKKDANTANDNGPYCCISV